MTESFTIRTPCSSANIGPGFDVIGLALSLYLELHVTIDRAKEKSEHPLNCRVTYEGDSADSGEVPLDPDANLITRVALYVLRCHNQRAFPVETHVHIKNPIPLGRGLGSSGAAVVAGVMLGKEVGQLDLSLDRLFDFALMIGNVGLHCNRGVQLADRHPERHPDNVGAALFGGFVGTYLKPLTPEDVARKEIPLSEVLPAPAGGIDTGVQPPDPPLGIGHHIKFRWAPEIKAVAIIPAFEVPTAKAREVLPAQYPRPDVVSRPSPVHLVMRETSLPR
jgi:homoserine kinase